MKNIIVLFVLIVASSILLGAQSFKEDINITQIEYVDVVKKDTINQAYCEGFKQGFKEGYCYKQYSCVPPVPPPCPVPRVGFSDYRDGYNRGFIRGKKKAKNE